jgi:hypothetical protein
MLGLLSQITLPDRVTLKWPEFPNSPPGLP